MAAEPTIVDVHTTLLMRNLPSSFDQQALLSLLDRFFPSRYNFLYLPIDFASGNSMGYGFVNFEDAEDAALALQQLNGFSQWHEACDKVMEACWSSTLQGQAHLIDRFRNSRVMHSKVPDRYKPLLFQDGKRTKFPVATKRIRYPM